jgi:hypothetical protein
MDCKSPREATVNRFPDRFVSFCFRVLSNPIKPPTLHITHKAISYFLLTLQSILTPASARTSRMSGAAAGNNPTAKLQEDKKAEIDPATTSQPSSQPNTLEEDDEFEDFPVEGELRLRIIASHSVKCASGADVSCLEQTGHRRKLKYPEATPIYGRRVGMMMMRMKTFRSN